MTIKFEFAKLTNAKMLGEELKAAGFAYEGISSNYDGVTIIYLRDAETKDPADIVKAHKYIAPKTQEEIQAEQKQRWAKAKTLAEIKEILGEKLGLK